VAEKQWQLYNWPPLNIQHGHNKRVPEGAWQLKESTSIIDVSAIGTKAIKDYGFRRNV
jgi:hypothetical protein